MSTKITEYGIETSLKNLGISQRNKGVSSGGSYFANGDMRESYSPTDGKLIAEIKTASAQER